MSDVEPGTPYLEHFPPDGGPMQRTVLAKFPFVIGRSESCDLRIDSTQVSREHARFTRHANELRVQDLGSTNGTFVNGQRVSDARLEHGDIVHVASTEFSFHSGVAAHSQAAATQIMDPRDVRGTQLGPPVAVIRAVRRFHEVLVRGAVRLSYQPIVHLESEEVLGYSALGVTTLDRSTQLAGERFLLMNESRLADRLSQTLRLGAAQETRGLEEGVRVILSVQAAEFGHESLLESLGALGRTSGSGKRLVLEIPEIAINEGTYLSRFRDRANEHGIGLAYGGFAAGKARLTELAELPPEYLLLERSLVQGVQLTKPRQKQARDVVSACDQMGVHVIATGVDTREEVDAWLGLGCKWGQGSFLGRAQPLAAWLGASISLARVGS